MTNDVEPRMTVYISHGERILDGRDQEQIDVVDLPSAQKEFKPL